jgi:hypothetical protein
LSHIFLKSRLCADSALFAKNASRKIREARQKLDPQKIGVFETPHFAPEHPAGFPSGAMYAENEEDLAIWSARPSGNWAVNPS